MKGFLRFLSLSIKNIFKYFQMICEYEKVYLILQDKIILPSEIIKNGTK
jgi:hypothetical protein